MTGRNSEELQGVNLLGNQNTRYTYDYDPSVLETFVNKHPENDYVVTFDAYEFTSLCVTGDTLIDVACDEDKFPNGVAIQDLVGCEGYVFGFDTESRQPVARRYHDVRQTGSQVPVVKVIMECLYGNASAGTQRWVTSSIRCTPDHQILVKKGFKDYEWVAAKDLKPGMRLIADQRSGDCIRGCARHRLIGEALFDEDIKIIHHIDGRHSNNSPTNLENVTVSEHNHHHRSIEYGYDDSLDIDALVSLYNSGENVHSLAQKFHCDDSTIKNRLKGLIEFRTQGESLSLRTDTTERDAEMVALYQKGYLVSEIADYVQLHPTQVSRIIKSLGVEMRESNFARYNRRKLNLPPLNHRVVSVIPDGVADVYNMEVEDVENYFANEVVIHNCPKTGQPDLAKIIISYIPSEKMVESKSLKLYLFSFRNHGDFHEDCVNIIMKDLVTLMEPKYLEVRGIFAPRGGIAIFPFSTYVHPEHSEYKEFETARRLAVMQSAVERKVTYDA